MLEMPSSSTLSFRMFSLLQCRLDPSLDCSRPQQSCETRPTRGCCKAVAILCTLT
jgi:hypothetical protein